MSGRHIARTSKDLDNKSMLASLVMGNSNVLGLLAYSLYVQCKEEWRTEFIKTFRREPNAHETLIFELGERTTRRKITYRFLADARLTGEYPDIRTDVARHSFIQKTYEARAKAAILTRPVPQGLGLPVRRVFAALLIFALGVALPLTPTFREPQRTTAAAAGAPPPSPPPKSIPQKTDGWRSVDGVPINPLD